MAQNKTALKAESRAKAGKGAARELRRQGKIPAVVYGDKQEPVLVTLNGHELGLALRKKGFFTQLCDLSIDGKSHLVLPRDVQVEPVYDRPEHVDFLRVSEKTRISVDVPVRAINEKESPGFVKGGVLNFVRHEIEVYCSATNIPGEFVADLTGLDVGESLHVEDLKLPEGVEPTTEGNFTVITLVAPSALKSDEDAASSAAAAAGAEGAAAAPAAEGAAAPAGDAAKAPAAKAPAKAEEKKK